MAPSGICHERQTCTNRCFSEHVRERFVIKRVQESQASAWENIPEHVCDWETPSYETWNVLRRNKENDMAIKLIHATVHCASSYIKLLPPPFNNCEWLRKCISRPGHYFVLKLGNHTTYKWILHTNDYHRWHRFKKNSFKKQLYLTSENLFTLWYPNDERKQ